MKIQLYILFILLFIQVPINSQSILDENNQWNIRFSSFGPTINTHAIRVNGDIVIDNQTYKIVQRSEDELNTNWENLNYYLREDVNSKKIYLHNGNSEQLLYDFNLELGDTFNISPQCTLIVNNVESITLNNG